MCTPVSRRAVLAAGAAVVAAPFLRAAAPKRNVLFIASDDLNTCLGADGSLGQELYDYDADPREVRNLSDDPRAADLEARFHAQLAEIRRARPAVQA